MHADFTRTLQTIWLALMAGVALFLAVALFMAPQIAADEGLPEGLFFALVALTSLVGIGIGFWIQGRMRAGTPPGGGGPQGVQTGFILSYAPLEASAFLALVGYLLTEQVLLLAFLVPFFAFGLLFFPSQARVEDLVEQAESRP